MFARVGEPESQLEGLGERLAKVPKTLSPTTIYKQMEKLQPMKAEADEIEPTRSYWVWSGT